jgi:hypothetical protein
MPRRTPAFALVLLTNSLAATAPGPAPVPVAFVAVRSTDAGLQGFKHLAPLLGKEAWPPAVEAFLRLRTGGVALEGLDRQQPLGAYLLWPADLHDLASFQAPVVLFVPVNDEKKFLGLLGKLGCEPRQGDGSLYRLSVPGLPELSLRFAHGHAYAAARPDLLRKPIAPDTFLPKGGPQSLLSAVLRVEHFPDTAGEALHKPLIPLLEGVAKHPDLAPLAERLPGEVPTNYRKRKELMETLRPGSPFWPELINAALRQVRRAAWTVDLDTGRHQLALGLVLEPRSETGLATFCGYAGTARSRCAPLATGAAASVVVHIPAVPAWRESASDVKIDDLPGVVRNNLDARWSDAVVKALQVGVQTIVTDGLDFCIVARAPKPGEDEVLLIGLKVQKGRKIDHLIRDAIKDLPATDKAAQKVVWNLDRHAGAHIHRFAEGSSEALLLTARDDLVLIGFEDKSLGVVREALDAYDKTPSSPTPLLQVDVTATALTDYKAIAEALQKVVPRGEEGGVRARFRLQGGKDLRVRVEASTYWLAIVRKLME